jgi:multicomponent Na+:H+ antiporter subunit D
MGADLLHGLVVAPVLVPLATSLAATLAAARPRLQVTIGLGGAVALLAVSIGLTAAVSDRGPLVTGLGGWDAPFAIAFAADPLACGFVLVAAVMGLAALVFQQGDADAAPEAPTLVPLVHAFLAGACGAFLTADLFNLYVWLEVVLVASLGLLALGAGRRHLDAALRYFVLNVTGTLLVLLGVVLVYTVTGHLNFAAVAEMLRQSGARTVVPATALLLTGVLFKAAAFPFSAWLPATYHTLPAPLLALFAALGTKVGVYAVIRLQGGVLDAVAPLTSEALGWLAAATMVAGVLGAAHHWDLRRILAFHSISQVGYMLLGVALDSDAGTTGAFVFAVHHSIVKANLFFIAALVFRSAGSYDLRRVGGLRAARPWLGALFLTQALALVGIPPLSGFWAKLLIVRESLATGHVAWAAIALWVGALTLYSMVKIWMEAFWKPHPDAGWRAAPLAVTGLSTSVAVVLAGMTVVVGVWPEPFLRVAATAALVVSGR